MDGKMSTLNGAVRVECEMDGTCNRVGSNDKFMPYFGLETPIKGHLKDSGEKKGRYY